MIKLLCLAEQDGGKICSYFEIVKIAWTPPPVFLDTYKAFLWLKKAQYFFFKMSKFKQKSAPKVFGKCQNSSKKVPQKIWILVGPPSLWTMSKYEQIFSQSNMSAMVFKNLQSSWQSATFAGSLQLIWHSVICLNKGIGLGHINLICFADSFAFANPTNVVIAWKSFSPGTTTLSLVVDWYSIQSVSEVAGTDRIRFRLDYLVPP